MGTRRISGAHNATRLAEPTQIGYWPNRPRSVSRADNSSSRQDKALSGQICASTASRNLAASPSISRTKGDYSYFSFGVFRGVSMVGREECSHRVNSDEM